MNKFLCILSCTMYLDDDIRLPVYIKTFHRKILLNWKLRGCKHMIKARSTSVSS